MNRKSRRAKLLRLRNIFLYQSIICNFLYSFTSTFLSSSSLTMIHNCAVFVSIHVTFAWRFVASNSSCDKLQQHSTIHMLNMTSIVSHDAINYFSRLQASFLLRHVKKHIKFPSHHEENIISRKQGSSREWNYFLFCHKFVFVRIL